MNGNAPFFWHKSLEINISCFPMWTAMLRFLCDLAIKNTILATGERQYSVFLSDFQCFRRYWTDMLRFFSRFQADFQLTSGWIEPLLVGGYAPFSPSVPAKWIRTSRWYVLNIYTCNNAYADVFQTDFGWRLQLMGMILRIVSSRIVG